MEEIEALMDAGTLRRMTEEEKKLMLEESRIVSRQVNLAGVSCICHLMDDNVSSERHWKIRYQPLFPQCIFSLGGRDLRKFYDSFGLAMLSLRV